MDHETMDSDGNVRAFKAVRDEIAKYAHLDDAERVGWTLDLRTPSQRRLRHHAEDDRWQVHYTVRKQYKGRIVDPRAKHAFVRLYGPRRKYVDVMVSWHATVTEYSDEIITDGRSTDHQARPSARDVLRTDRAFGKRSGGSDDCHLSTICPQVCHVHITSTNVPPVQWIPPATLSNPTRTNRGSH